MYTPGLVVVEGPPGIGKTALVNRFLESAEDAHVLRASGEESEANLAFGVLTQLTAAGPNPEPDARPAFEGDGAGTPRDVTTVDPLLAGARLLEILGELQRSRPVIVALDDVHWADFASLQALTFAVRRLSKDRILVVVSLRDLDHPGVHEGFRRLLAGEAATRLTLAGLGNEDLRRLSAAMVGEPLSPRAAARLRNHTAGSPLHARALLGQLPLGAFQNAEVPLPAPRAFALLVLGRLAKCSPETRRFVAAASVLAGRGPFHIVSDVAEVADPLRALDEATEAGLLVEVPPGRVVEFPASTPAGRRLRRTWSIRTQRDAPQSRRTRRRRTDTPASSAPRSDRPGSRARPRVGTLRP